MENVYDVFISKNTLDLSIAQKVAEQLKEAGLSVFESDESLPRIGQSDYGNAIDHALDKSRNLLVICSGNENGETSPWVKHEWSSFRIEVLNRRKDGNIVVILQRGIELGSLAFGLRQYQFFWYDDLDYSKLISYFRPDLCADAGRGRERTDVLHHAEEDTAEGIIVKRTIVIDNLAFDMIRVEGGGFSMNGSRSKIPSFYIGQLPVTEDLWDKVMGKSQGRKKFLKNGLLTTSLATAVSIMVAPPLAFPALVGSVASGSFLSLSSSLPNRSSLSKPYRKASHADAMEFVGRLSQMTGIDFSLPTEEEWEYAARGGRFEQGLLYAGSDEIDDVGWYVGNSNASVRRVGQKKPNELGLYDMCGNVLEWTDTLCPETNQYVRRGGNCYSRADHCQVSSRVTASIPLVGQFYATGLRLVARNLNVSLE